MAARLLPMAENRIRYADSFEFIGWYAAEIVRTVSGWFRESGIEVPISANSWSPLYADFAKLCEKADIAGMDIYPSVYYEGRKPVKDNWLYNVDILKMAEANVTHGNVWCGEFQCGIYPLRDTGYIPPDHFRFVALSLMARGLKVWNWYLLVVQYNWPHSPINEWGWPNEYFPIHKETLALTQRIEPWNLTPLHDLGLIVYKPHRVIDPGNFEAVFHALESADLSYAYVDPQMTAPILHPVLLYCGSDWLDASALARIESYVENGGILITFSQAPFRDEFGQPSRLPFIAPEGARPVNLPVTVSYKDGAVILCHGGHLGCKVNFCYFSKVAGDPIRVTLSTRARETLVDVGAAAAASFAIGYVRPFGKGKIVYLGSNPSAETLEMVLTAEGYRPYVSANEALVTTSLFRHADGSLRLFVVNQNPHRCAASVTFHAARLAIAANARLSLAPISGAAGSPIEFDSNAGVRVEVAGHDVEVFRVAINQ